MSILPYCLISRLKTLNPNYPGPNFKDWSLGYSLWQSMVSPSIEDSLGNSQSIILNWWIEYYRVGCIPNCHIKPRIFNRSVDKSDQDEALGWSYGLWDVLASCCLMVKLTLGGFNNPCSRVNSLQEQLTSHTLIIHNMSVPLKHV